MSIINKDGIFLTNPTERTKNKKKKERFYNYPILTTNLQSSPSYNSLLFKMKHKEQPIDKSKKINFTVNRGLYKANFLSFSLKKESKQPLDLDTLTYLLSQDFNKMNKKSNKIYSSITTRDQVKEEMMNRRLAKYINNKKKYIKTEIKKESQIKVSKAKDIVISKLPRIRSLGYQSMSSEPIYFNQNSNRVKNIEISI